MLETSRCISIFGQIVATVPFYTRANFDMDQNSINKSTIYVENGENLKKRTRK